MQQTASSSSGAAASSGSGLALPLDAALQLVVHMAGVVNRTHILNVVSTAMMLSYIDDGARDILF